MNSVSDVSTAAAMDVVHSTDATPKISSTQPRTFGHDNNMLNNSETPAPIETSAKVETDTDMEAHNGQGSTVFKPTRSFLLAFSALCVVLLAVAFDATTLSVALPIMSAKIGGTALEAFWSGTSFLLASAVFQPTLAALSTIFGRKHLIYLSAVFFAAGSLVAALANNFTVVIVGRTLQGTGGGGLIALCEMVVTDLVPLAVRGQYLSLIAAIWALGTVTGPLIGAGFAQDVTWRWIFYVNLPIIGAGTFLVALFLNQRKLPGEFFAKLARFDWVGSALFTIGSTSFLFGITTGGVMYDWDSWRCLVPLILGPFILVAFGFWEVLMAKEPLIHKNLFTNRTLIITYIMTLFHGAALWSILYFLVLYYQAVKLYSPIISAVAALPETLTVAPASMVVGVIAASTGRYRWSIWSGWLIATLGMGIILLLDLDTSIPQWIFLNIPVGVGTGMLFPAMALSIQAACTPELNPDAASFFSFVRTFGQGIGVAISGVIFQNSFRRELNKSEFFADMAKEYSRDATIVVDLIKRMEDGPAKKELMTAYNEGLKSIWIALLAICGFCSLLSIFVKSYTLQQAHETKQAFVDKSKLKKADKQ